jgi:hypothetical protein
MNVRELKEALKEFPDDATVLVTYSVAPHCSCAERGNYCYCGYEHIEDGISYVCPKETKTLKKNHPVVQTVMICL